MWSSAWVAAAAATLTGAASLALGHPPAGAVLVLAFAGTLVVYAIDRLRDLELDRVTAPERSAFIERHRRWLEIQTGAAALVAAGTAWLAGSRVVAVAAGVGVLGLLHRRLKHVAWAKPVYLAGAWTAVCVGMPAAHASASSALLPVSVAVGATVLANVALSNLRDGEGMTEQLGRRRVLALAAVFLGVSFAAALLGGTATRPLAALPLASLPAVAFFHPGERFGGLVVDGALVIGGAVAWTLAL